jgi:hypothetical protein
MQPLVPFDTIYQQWHAIAETQPHFALKTFEQRSQVFAAYKRSMTQQNWGQILHSSPVPAEYFDGEADAEQRLRDMLECAYFENHHQESLIFRAQKIMSDKKHDEAQSLIQALVEEVNYERLIQIRYNTHINEARQKAFRDLMAFYRQNFPQKQPEHQQGPMFPRLDQVMQNSLYDSKSYAQGWIGYTAGAFIASIAHGFGSALKKSQQLIDKNHQAFQLLEQIDTLDNAMENQALSYVLLTLRERGKNVFSEQQKALIQGMIDQRAARLGIDPLIANLAEYRRNNSVYTRWADKKIDDLNLHCCLDPLKEALRLYKDLYYTHLYSQTVFQLRHGLPLALLENNPTQEFALENENLDELEALPKESLFLSQTLQRFAHFIENTNNIGVLDESVAVLAQQAGQRSFNTCTNTHHRDELFQTACTQQNTSMVQALSSGIAELCQTAGIEAGQYFIKLEYKYLAGGEQQGQDGMSSELKAQLAANERRRRPAAP